MEEAFDLIVCDGRLKAGVAHLTEYLFAEIKANPPAVDTLTLCDLKWGRKEGKVDHNGSKSFDWMTMQSPIPGLFNLGYPVMYYTTPFRSVLITTGVYSPLTP